jgi:hypothetical protein
MQTDAQIGQMYERARDNELSRYLAKQEAAEIRAAMVEQRTKDLMQVGQDFYPWEFANFEEAVDNAPLAERKIMFSFIAAAVGSGFNNEYANHAALVAVRQLVERYWVVVAAKVADAEDFE